MAAKDSGSDTGGASSEATRPLASLPVVILAGLGLLAAMYLARDVLIPIALALLLALLLRPLLQRLRQLRIPDLIGAFLLVGGVAALFLVGLWKLADQGQHWLKEGPATIQRVQQMIPRRSGPIGDLQQTTKAVQDLAKPANGPEPIKVEMESPETAYTVLGVSGHFVGAAVIVFVLGYFLLAFSETLLRQAIASRGTFMEKRNIVELVHNVERGISRYLLTITTINIGLGIATGLLMWALRIPNPVLWGVMATLLNYVPHVGAFLCMVVLFFVGTVTHQSLLYGGMTAGAFMVLTSIESYFVTPMVLSKSLQLSPLAVLLAILFWGWMWGVAGGLMAAPLLAVVKIVCDQFDSLQPLAAFLAGEAPGGNKQEPAEVRERGSAAPHGMARAS